jgi:hypothetical protein
MTTGPGWECLRAPDVLPVTRTCRPSHSHPEGRGGSGKGSGDDIIVDFKLKLSTEERERGKGEREIGEEGRWEQAAIAAAVFLIRGPSPDRSRFAGFGDRAFAAFRHQIGRKKIKVISVDVVRLLRARVLRWF